MHFSLLSNPFAVLDLADDASVSVIAGRARQLDGPAAAAASRMLIVPRTRLIAEMSFLPGAPQDLVTSCLEDLRASRIPDLWALTPLARANVLAHLASAGMATASQMRDLVGLQDAIRSFSADSIDQAWGRAGLPKVAPEMLASSLETVAGKHAEAFANGMLTLPRGSELFAEHLQTTSLDATARVTFLREAAAAWDRATTSKVAEELEAAAPIEAGRVRQAGVDSWCSEGIHRHFSFGGVEVDWIVWCDDGPSDGATAAIAAVKPCAFGAPLRGCGA